MAELPSWNNKSRERNEWYENRKKEDKLPTFARLYMTLYLKDPKDCFKNSSI
jgi:hypothetical protein